MKLFFAIVISLSFASAYWTHHNERERAEIKQLKIKIETLQKDQDNLTDEFALCWKEKQKWIMECIRLKNKKGG
ncbi:hypothetical protein KKG36_01165 [Patescibacteria group bacterium]|nr:hypothetical protein [Patescibacteria group bacterium]